MGRSDVLRSDQALRRDPDLVSHLVSVLDVGLERDLVSVLGLDLDLVRGRDLVSHFVVDVVLDSGLRSVRDLVRDFVVDRDGVVDRGFLSALGSGLGLGFGLDTEVGKWAEQDLTRQQYESLGHDPARTYLFLLLLVWARLATIAWAIAIPDEADIDGAAAPRKAELEPESASRALAAAGRTLGGFDQLAASGELAAWDEKFVRHTLEQITLWGRRDDANPQIFELLIADLVKRFEATLPMNHCTAG